MKCHVCNFEVNETDENCNNCGAKIQVLESDNNEVVNEVKILEEVVNEENKCPNCGTKYNEADKFCIKCGKKISKGEDLDSHCHICNSKINKTDKFCNNCGAKQNTGISIEPQRDIIAERFNNKIPVRSSKSYLVLWLSIAAAGISFILSGFFPYITGILGLGALGFAIYKLVKERTRLAGWSIAIAIVALMISGLNIVNELMARDYAYASADRISEIVDVNLPDVEPSFYDITMIDGQVVKVTFTMFDFNDIIYELDENDARDFVALIDQNGNFREDYIDILNEEFGIIMLSGADKALVYNLKTKTFALPMDLDNYDLIVINYDYETSTIQVLELSSKLVDFNE